MPSGCASGSRSSPRARSAFEGAVDEARGRLRPIVHLRTRAEDGPWRAALPAAAKRIGGEWRFELPEERPRAAAQGADRRRRRDRDAEHRAARPARRLHRHRRRGRRARDGPCAGRRRKPHETARDDPRRLRHRPPRFHRDGAEQDLPVLPARPAVPDRCSASASAGSARRSKETPAAAGRGHRFAGRISRCSRRRGSGCRRWPTSARWSSLRRVEPERRPCRAATSAC